jgi:hypothetical protein
MVCVRSSPVKKSGRFIETIEDINRSVELDPQSGGAPHHRGKVLFTLNRLEEGYRAYEQAVN